MPPSLLDGVRDVAVLLRAWGRPAAIVGGVAFVARVRPRFTDDLDLAVTVPKDQLEAFADLAAQQGFSFGPQDRQFFREAGLLPMKSPSGLHVVVMLADDLLLESTVQRATVLDLGGIPLPVATAEDLLLLKLDANRPMDFDDAIAIKDAFGATLDRAHLRRLAVPLGILERVENLLGPC